MSDSRDIWIYGDFNVYQVVRLLVPEPHFENQQVERRRFRGRPCFSPVLTGTFITEWNEGGRLCEAFLAGDERSYQAVADRLVQIAQFFRFDGWLINIENSLSVSAQPSPTSLPVAVLPPTSTSFLPWPHLAPHLGCRLQQ